MNQGLTDTIEFTEYRGYKIKTSLRLADDFSTYWAAKVMRLPDIQDFADTREDALALAKDSLDMILDDNPELANKDKG